MNDDTTVALLRRALADEAQGHHLAPDAAEVAIADARRSRGPGGRRTAVAVGAALVGAAAVAAVYAVSSGGPRDTAPSAASCGTMEHGALPVWARAGFTPPDQPIDHIVSDGGRIVAVPFVRLRVHQPPGTHNKILWSARDGGTGTPLVIRASLAGRPGTVTRTVAGGPGPSYVDLPAAGCWHLDLQWGTQHDSMSIAYAP